MIACFWQWCTAFLAILLNSYLAYTKGERALLAVYSTADNKKGAVLCAESPRVSSQCRYFLASQVTPH
jgi:hypothetical protein